MESRHHKGTVEIRANADGDPVIFGYFAVFNRDSADMGFIEQVDPKAFDKTVKEADVRGLGNHDVNWLLGRAKSETLRLGIDSTGGWYEIDVNEADPDGQRALQKVKRGDWDGSSFSFKTIRDEWNWDANPPQRRLLEVGLIDVGPVTFPAYPDATAAARALEPIAAKVGRPVDELVTAMARGEIRSLLDADPEARAASGAAVTVAWGPEDGFNDLVSDLNQLLNPAGSWRYCVLDVAVALDKALVCDWQESDYWVAPITVGDDGEPVLSPSSDWTEVEQGWIEASDDVGRALALMKESRAGKVLSAKSKAHVMAAYEALRDLLDQAKEEDSIVSAKEQDSLRMSFDDADRELRLRELAAAA